MSAFLSFILGSIITFLAGWYFHRKAVQKNGITPFLDYFSKVFDVDPELKKDLYMKYKGKEIEFLYDIQFTIRNTGNKSLREILEPLTLNIPTELEVVDTRLLNIIPQGRKIEMVEQNSNKIKFIFPLLNREDSFSIKVLLTGDISKLLEAKRKNIHKSKIGNLLSPVDDEINDENIIDDFLFTITVDDLPPSLKIKKSQTLQEDDSDRLDWLSGFLSLYVGLSMGYVLWFFTNKHEEYYIFDRHIFFQKFFDCSGGILTPECNIKSSIFIIWMMALLFTMMGIKYFILRAAGRLILFFTKWAYKI